MTTPKRQRRDRVWDDSYVPTQEELEEVVKIEATPEELVRAVANYKRPIS